ncbi:glycosyltransferase [Ideonella sp. 4Y16]|uniref:glycosyltransferase n=1 Tax=Ideonella alba TaxID=2824118 RepID=UPI001B368A05|nr:nucleotide disphospho-sugar-binding domain-containing protein [Ideonella alba]MBQ0942185.1 glycosyltransferase [Ideonella alba]
MTSPRADRPPEVVVVAVGSGGDVLPLAAVALALQARGRRVQMLCPASQQPRLSALGLSVAPLLSPEQEQALLADPALWQPARALDSLWPMALSAAQATLAALDPLVQAGARPLLLGSTLALGARLAAERWQLRWITAHGAPAWLFNPHDFPRLPGAGWLRAWPAAWRAPAWRWAERRWLDPQLDPGWSALRQAWGLPAQPARQLISRGLSSPGPLLGMFPDGWAGPPWTQRLHCTGFPLFDGHAAGTPLPPAWVDWLAERRPIVGLAGTAMWQAGAWQQRLAWAAERLGRPLLLLGPAPAGVAWPGDCRQAVDLPLRAVLPHTDLVVSHPGVGTTALALAAGVPQLLVPWAFDHADNAARLQRRGVARVVPPSTSLPGLVRQMQAMLADRALRAHCRAVAATLPPGDQATAAAADVVEAALR